MSEWAPKRFWKSTEISETENGFQVQLDGRPVRTPSKTLLELPSRGMAEAIAAEWDKVEEKIDPSLMPVTRAANAAIDKVTIQHSEVAAMLAAYAETDLLCHRAEHPDGLIQKQKEAWDPILDWAATRYSAPLISVSGILPAVQPENSLQTYLTVVMSFGPFSMTALHDLVGISGSLLLGLWVAEDQSRAKTAWDISRIDEEWQISQWGEDEEASETAAKKQAEFLNAARFLTLSDGF